MIYHISVLIDEVLSGLQVQKGKRYIDATFGGGGHAQAMLDHGARVLGIDIDQDALNEAKRIKNTGFQIKRGNFADIERIAQEAQYTGVDGVLFDLGLSSHQLEEKTRGFSYQQGDAPLDMRYAQDQFETAAEILAHAQEKQLEEIFIMYGEEKYAKRISQEIVHKRRTHPFRQSNDLLTLIRTCIGENERVEPVASRIFQSLRIAVNNELVALKRGLEGAVKIIKQGGRIGVISYHSLEDRIVKLFFLHKDARIVNKKPIEAQEREIQMNARARSAKLRIAEIVRYDV